MPGVPYTMGSSWPPAFRPLLARALRCLTLNTILFDVPERDGNDPRENDGYCHRDSIWRKVFRSLRMIIFCKIRISPRAPFANFFNQLLLANFLIPLLKENFLNNLYLYLYLK